MIGKLLAAALVIAPSSANPRVNPAWQWAATDNRAVTETGVDPSTHPEIVRVDCEGTRGSAVKVGPNILLSVAHVTDGEGCKIGGVPIRVIEQKGDFSILASDEITDRWLRIDCDGFVKGRKYTAIGFARGLGSLTTIDVVATGETIWSFERLWGVFTVIPGQSGGGFVDSITNRLVGMVNVYESRRGDSGGVALKGTSLCRDSSTAAL